MRTTPSWTDTRSIPWVNGLDVVRSMTPEFRDNLGPAEQLEDTYARYNQKTLRLDADTGRRIDLVHLAPGFRDLTNAYHDSVEECFVLSGSFWLTGEGDFTAGDYFWRPPGFVHAAGTTHGFVALLMLQGEDPQEGSWMTSRRIRPEEEAGTNALHDAGDTRAVGPRGWVQRQPSWHLPWLPGAAWQRDHSDLSGMDLEHLSVRVLSANRLHGGQSLLLRLSAGFSQQTLRTNQGVELYVVEGALRADGEQIGPGSYLRVDPDANLPRMAADAQTLLFAKIDGRLQLQPV